MAEDYYKGTQTGLLSDGLVPQAMLTRVQNLGFGSTGLQIFSQSAELSHLEPNLIIS